MQSNTRPAAHPLAPAAAPPGSPVPPPADLGTLLTAELVTVLASARRRASRDGDRQIDTAHLLHSLLEADPLVRAAFEPTQIARLLGYLVQRSIGFGLQWQSSVEASGGIPVISQRDVEKYRGGGREQAKGTGKGAGNDPEKDGRKDEAPSDRPPSGDATGRGQERWSPAAAAALHRAASRARSRGEDRADGADLLAALAADGESRAVEVLRSAGVDITVTLSALPH